MATAAPQAGASLPASRARAPSRKNAAPMSGKCWTVVCVSVWRTVWVRLPALLASARHRHKAKLAYRLSVWHLRRSTKAETFDSCLRAQASRLRQESPSQARLVLQRRGTMRVPSGSGIDLVSTEALCCRRRVGRLGIGSARILGKSELSGGVRPLAHKRLPLT